MITIAYAMGPGVGQGGEAGGFTAFVPLILMFVIFYFLLIRPQQKKTKEHQQMVSALKKGNKVVTSGGIHGVITSTDEATVTLEVADKVEIKILRGNVSVIVDAKNAAQKSKKKQK